MKGREAPVAASRLVGPKASEPSAAVTPLVGRERELGTLAEALEELVSGRGRIVLLVGPPGIGKTRLLQELRSLAAERVTWLVGQCHSYGGLPAWPLLEAFLGWLGAAVGEPEIALRTKARAKLGSLGPERADTLLPLLAPLARGLGGREDFQTAYVHWIEALAAERPVVIAVEDVHWADTATRQLVETLFDLAERAPIGLFLTAEHAPGSEGADLRLRALGDHGHRTIEVTLGPLTDEASEQLVAAVLDRELDPVTRIGLVREAEGNPLYLEELARALDEGGLQPRGRTWTITIRSNLLPPALENVLVARIDRLPESARRTAQAAAAIGRVFPVEILDLVAEDAREGLTSLLRAEVVREVRRYPSFECTFTHGLLHEAALSTLTPARKRELFRSIAAVESHYADTLDDHVERLAHYHAQVGNLPKALEYAAHARGTSG